MRNKFLISIGITVVLPALLIGFFAGVDVLVNFLIWLLVLGAALIAIVYYFTTSGKTMLGKITSFETGLWVTSLLIKFEGLFLAISLFASGAVLYLVFGADFKSTYGNLPLIAAILLTISLIILFISFFFWVGSQIIRQTKPGYFLGLLIGLLFIPLLLGVFPVWFFLRYRSAYFLKEKFDNQA